MSVNICVYCIRRTLMPLFDPDSGLLVVAGNVCNQLLTYFELKKNIYIYWILISLWIVFPQGESVIDCFEVNTSEPFLSQGNSDVFSWSSSFFMFPEADLSVLLSVSHCLTDASTRGVALVPKLAVDVGCCEVLRLMQLTDSFIVPISYQVPRKVRTNTTLTLNTHIRLCWTSTFLMHLVYPTLIMTCKLTCNRNIFQPAWEP